jgi:hypothetical protein
MAVSSTERNFLVRKFTAIAGVYLKENSYQVLLLVCVFVECNIFTIHYLSNTLSLYIVMSIPGVSNTRFSMAAYGPIQFSNYTRCGAPHVQLLIHSNFKIRVKYLLLFRCFIFRLHKEEMRFDEIHIGVCLQEKKEEKYIAQLNLGTSKSKWFWSSCPCGGSQRSHVFFKRPIIKFDISSQRSL